MLLTSNFLLSVQSDCQAHYEERIQNLEIDNHSKQERILQLEQELEALRVSFAHLHKISSHGKEKKWHELG